MTRTVNLSRQFCIGKKRSRCLSVAGLPAPPARFERAACGFEVRRSVQLSYGGRCVYCDKSRIKSGFLG